MTIAEVFKQAQSLSLQERKELVRLLVDTLDSTEPTHQPKTGAEIAAILTAMEPIEFVDPHIHDPVEWVKAQRRKRTEQLKLYRDVDRE